MLQEENESLKSRAAALQEQLQKAHSDLEKLKEEATKKDKTMAGKNKQLQVLVHKMRLELDQTKIAQAAAKK